MPVKTFLQTVLLVFVACFIARGQNKNPYKEIGKKGKVLTLTKNAQGETFDDEDVQQIGTALINIRTNKIVKLLTEEEAKARLDNTAGRRFLSVDPLTNKYPMLSPYQFASNTPIWAKDMDGQEGIVTNFRPYLASASMQRISNEAILLKIQHPTWSSFRVWTKATWNVNVGQAHDMLDIMGLTPVLGEPLDIMNGMLYTIEGNGQDAMLSFAATVPLAGAGVTGLKWAKKALKFSDNAFQSASGLIFKIGSKHGNRLAHVIEHTADDLSKFKHGVFDVGNKLVETLDDAYSQVINTKWSKKLNVGESETMGGITKTLQESTLSDGTKELRESFIIDMGKKVGYEGGKKGTGDALNKINLVLKEGSGEVITAFPTK